MACYSIANILDEALKEIYKERMGHDLLAGATGIIDPCGD